MRFKSKQSQPGLRGRCRRGLGMLSVGVLLASAAVGVGAVASPAQASDNGAALTPPAGWSSWSFIRNSPNEAKIKAQAKGMHDSGLVDHGFSYINIDDYYYKNPNNTVDQYGRWVVDTGKFPDGMANMAAYVHGLGEKFGMYVTPGIPVAAYNQNTPIQGTSFHARDIVSSTSTYESNYGGFGNVMYYIDYKKNPAAAQAYVNSWADLFASYGVDYIKIDGVHTSDQDDVMAWSKALAQSGRVIHLELSNSLDINNIATWKQYANGWRINGDIEAYGSSNLTSWNNVTSRFTLLPKWAAYAGKGGWNDPDSLELGNGTSDGMTPTERQSTMTLWSISAAPLLLGSDLTHMDATDLAMLTNDEVLAVDRAGHPALPVSQSSQQQVWRVANGDGSYTVALFNLSGSTATVKANWSDLGFSGGAGVRDLWSRTDLGNSTGSYSRSLPAHGSALLRVTPGTGNGGGGVTGGGGGTGGGGTGGGGVTATATGVVKSGITGRCLDLRADNTTSGDPVQLWDCNGTHAQSWSTYSDGTLQLAGKCLDAYAMGTTNGTKIELWDCNGGSNQVWQAYNGGYRNPVSGRCLDDPGSSPDGLQLQLYDCNGTVAQIWSKPGA